MTEYWKSQPRKFCEFCKCWTADNKASIDFHEKGKKHKDNVQAKLATLRKKGVQDAKERDKMSGYLRAMERGAMIAYQKDLKINPSLTNGPTVVSTEENSQTSTTNSSMKFPSPSVDPLLPTSQPTPDSDEDSQSYEEMLKRRMESKKRAQSKDTRLKKKKKEAESSEKPPVDPAYEPPPEDPDSAVNDDPYNWQEAVSPEGYTYYWNTVTNESRWEPPINYLPPEKKFVPDYEAGPSGPTPAASFTTTNSQKGSLETVSKDTSRTEGTITNTQLTVSIDSIPLPDDPKSPPKSNQASSADSTDNKPPTTEESDEPVEDPNQLTDSTSDLDLVNQQYPLPRPKGYNPGLGTWQPVNKKPQKVIDLELPLQKSKNKNTIKDRIEANMLEEDSEVIEPESIGKSQVVRPKFKFCEKKVSTIGAEFEAFKKRKLNSNNTNRNFKKK